MDLSDRIEHLRRSTGWSQVEIAARLGVTRQQISNIKAGKSGLSATKAERLSELESAASAVAEATSPYNAPPPAHLCPACERLEDEVAFLRRQLTYTQTKLDQAFALIASEQKKCTQPNS